MCHALGPKPLKHVAEAADRFQAWTLTTMPEQTDRLLVVPYGSTAELIQIRAVEGHPVRVGIAGSMGLRGALAPQ
jgi:hypothetical protein